MPLSHYWSPPAIVLILVPPLSAQLVGGQWDTLHQLDGNTIDGRFGEAVGGLGDIDGDGFDDFFIGESDSDPNGVLNAGSVHVISGNTGLEIYRLDGGGLNYKFGHAVCSIGDIDGDGVQDIAIGAQSASQFGSVFLFSGRTAAPLSRKYGYSTGDFFGTAVAGGGDIDGDGVPDWMGGAPGTDPNGIRDGGSVFAFSGASGQELLRINGTTIDQMLGYAVANAGDVDRDGRADVLIGSRHSSPNGRDSGSAFLYSGSNGLLIYRFDGAAGIYFLGYSVAHAGDVNGDGWPDILVSAPGWSPLGGPNVGAVYLFSGANGQEIIRIDGGNDPWGMFGHSISSVGDTDGDGNPDIFIGAPYTQSTSSSTNEGSAYLFSWSGSLLRRFDAGILDRHLGYSVSGAGDVDGDGLADLLVGGPRSYPNGSYETGNAYVYSLAPFLSSDSPFLSASSGVPTHLLLDFPQSEAYYAYVILASASGDGPSTLGGVQVPLTRDLILNRMLQGWTPSVLQGGRGTLDSNGNAVAVLSSHPLLARLVGRNFFLAAVSSNLMLTQGRLSSIARTITISP